jgi:SAM-dependent methyltransferase
MAEPDPYTLDWTEMAPRLARAASDERGWYEALAADLIRPGDTLALDIGCGGAGMTAALAAALPDGARVVAADHSPTVLDAAREHLASVPGLRAAVTFAVVDLDRDASALPAPADLIWASASVHHAGDQQAAVDTLAALLAPGGRLVLAEGGLRPRHLPGDVGVGEPGLEVRLDAAQDRWFARMRAGLPNSKPMPYGWTAALRRAGLVDVTTRTTLLERPVPLSDADREGVVRWLAQRLEWLRDTDLLSEADRTTWATLLDPERPEWLGHRDDLFSVEARSVQLGVRPS